MSRPSSSFEAFRAEVRLALRSDEWWIILPDPESIPVLTALQNRFFRCEDPTVFRVWSPIPFNPWGSTIAVFIRKERLPKPELCRFFDEYGGESDDGSGMNLGNGSVIALSPRPWSARMVGMIDTWLNEKWRLN